MIKGNRILYFGYVWLDDFPSKYESSLFIQVVFGSPPSKVSTIKMRIYYNSFFLYHCTVKEPTRIIKDTALVLKKKPDPDRT